MGDFYNGGLLGNIFFFIGSNWNFVSGYIKNVDISWKVHLEISSNTKVIVKKPLTNLYEINRSDQARYFHGRTQSKCPSQYDWNNVKETLNPSTNKQTIEILLGRVFALLNLYTFFFFRQEWFDIEFRNSKIQTPRIYYWQHHASTCKKTRIKHV